MLYQKMLIGNKPYFVGLSGAAPYEVHRHPEIEISYCISGGYDIICDGIRYTLNEGDYAVIAPMAAHEIPGCERECKKLTVEVGRLLLGESVTAFDGFCCILHKSGGELLSLFNETAALCSRTDNVSELKIRGNLYKICADILNTLNPPCSMQSKKTADIRKIDLALEKIYNNYFEQLSVSSVSAFCGYSKSNFCKIFKNVTGDTFHNTLNRHRVEVACILLRESDLAVDEIARDTGFADSKSFCRVFKSVMGVTAGEYRRNIRTTAV